MSTLLFISSWNYPLKTFIIIIIIIIIIINK